MVGGWRSSRQKERNEWAGKIKIYDRDEISGQKTEEEEEEGDEEEEKGRGGGKR